MEILVLVKQVPTELAKVELTLANTVDRGGCASSTNPVDKNALEAAVQLKEAQGGTVTVLTMGPESAKAVLKECISVRADKGVRVTDEAFAGSDAYATARVLAKAIQSLGPFDLILAGKQSWDGGTANVAPMVAEFLGLPQVTNVSGIEARDGAAVCKQMLDDGNTTVQVSLPAVVTVDEYINKPRYATIKSKLAANKAKFFVLTNAELGVGNVGLAGSFAKVQSASEPPVREEGVKITGESTQEVVEKLVAALVGANIL